METMSRGQTPERPDAEVYDPYELPRRHAKLAELLQEWRTIDELSVLMGRVKTDTVRVYLRELRKSHRIATSRYRPLKYKDLGPHESSHGG